SHSIWRPSFWRSVSRSWRAGRVLKRGRGTWEAGMAAEAAGQVAEQVAGAEHAAAEGAEGAFNAGDHIFHHILDSRTLGLPFLGEVHLPTLHIGGYALPITRTIVMMWVAAVIVILLTVLVTRRKRTVPGRTQSLVELLVVFIRDDVARKNIGEHGDK